MDYHSQIPGAAAPGSMGAGAHYPDVDPSLTTALILDPTGPGYRLDSKLVAELSAPLPTKTFSFPRFPLLLLVLLLLLGTLALYSEVAIHMSITTPDGTEDLASIQNARISTTTSAPHGVPFLQLDNVQAAHPNFDTTVNTTGPTHRRWRMHKF